MAKQGSKKVTTAGIDDKRQITGVFTLTLDGCSLPLQLQLIYQSTTSACLPSTAFPSDWHVTCSPNHWATESTTKDYIHKILTPYLSRNIKKLRVASDQQALCIFDSCKGQLTGDVLQILEDFHVDIMFISPYCTDQLQPLDLSVNKSAEDFKSRVSTLLLDDESPLQPISFSMHALGGRWLKEFFQYMQQNSKIVHNGIRAAGITDFY